VKKERIVSKMKSSKQKEETLAK